MRRAGAGGGRASRQGSPGDRGHAAVLGPCQAFWGAPRLPLTRSSTGSTQGTPAGTAGWVTLRADPSWPRCPGLGAGRGPPGTLPPPPGVTGLLFLASWQLVCGHGAVPGVWPAGWPGASMASRATALAGAGAPCRTAGLPARDPLRDPPIASPPINPQPTEGTRAAPVPLQQGQPPLHPAIPAWTPSCPGCPPVAHASVSPGGSGRTSPDAPPLHQVPQQLTLFILPAPGAGGHGDPPFVGH